jgi:hypothetical protein
MASRARFGERSGVLDRAGSTLYKRLMTLLDRYFVKNSKWKRLVDSSSETLQEASSAAWVALLNDRNAVTLAEVRFLRWVERRAMDYLRHRLARKNQNWSLEAMTLKDENGDEIRYENTLEGDEDDAPDRVLERKQLKARLSAMYVELEPLVRRAVYFRLECE